MWRTDASGAVSWARRAFLASGIVSWRARVFETPDDRIVAMFWHGTDDCTAGCTIVEELSLAGIPLRSSTLDGQVRSVRHAPDGALWLAGSAVHGRSPWWVRAPGGLAELASLCVVQETTRAWTTVTVTSTTSTGSLAEATLADEPALTVITTPAPLAMPDRCE